MSNELNAVRVTVTAEGDQPRDYVYPLTTVVSVQHVAEDLSKYTKYGSPAEGRVIKHHPSQVYPPPPEDRRRINARVELTQLDKVRRNRSTPKYLLTAVEARIEVLRRQIHAGRE